MEITENGSRIVEKPLNILKYLWKNNLLEKFNFAIFTKRILHHISANIHTGEYDAIKCVGSMYSLEVTLTVSNNPGLLRFPFPKSERAVQIFVLTYKILQL